MNAELYSPRSASEAVSLKTPSAAFLAGGTEILRHGSSVHADRLIMLKNTEGLKGITKEQDQTVKIGAMTTFAEALRSSAVPEYFRKAIRYMASGTKRNMATIGGNIALIRDDSYLAAVLIAAHAKLVLLMADGERGRDGAFAMERKELVCIRRYLLEPDLYLNALILSVLLREDVKVVSKRYANTAESHSFLTAAMGIVDGKVRIGVSVKNSGVFFLKELSEEVNDSADPGKILADFADSWNGLDIPDDIFGSQAYKRYLLGVTLTDLYRSLQEDRGEEVSDV